MKNVLKFAAIGEAITGLALLIVPSLVSRLLLGTELTGVSIPIARVTGIALIGLGIACWPNWTAASGMLTYSAGITLYLAYIAFVGEWVGPLLWPALVLHAVLTPLLAWAWFKHKTRDLRNGRVSDYKPRLKRHYGNALIAVLALIAGALLAQNPTPTLHSNQAELAKVEEWVLSQGIAEWIAPELAAILGLGSDRLPVKLKAFRTSDSLNLALAVSTNPKQEGIVISSLKTMTDKTKIYSVGTAWLTDTSGTLRQTIAVDASGAKVLPNNSHAAKFEVIKAFFIKKLTATAPTTSSPPSPRKFATPAKKNSH